MKYINAQQLAFILDIKKQDARAKMCVAYAAEKGEQNQAYYDEEDKLTDPYPQAMEVEMIGRHLNIDLVGAVEDIESNWLIRPATKKWILCDYPEKKIKSMDVAGKKKKIQIPAALASMLPVETKATIMKEWQKRYPKYF